VTFQILLLALGSALRPSSFVAVIALLRQRSPLRLMIAFVVTGLLFSLAIGAAIVWAFSGLDVGAGTDRARAIAEIAAGLLALFLGAAIASGRVRVAGTPQSSVGGGRLRRLGEHRITTREAALAGPATHIPGLLYLVALDLIVAEEPDLAGGLAELGLYNAIWFAIPIAVTLICIVEPQVARAGIERLQQWAGLHVRTLMLFICFGLGGYLLVAGLRTL
jgi:hypothetical protein